MRIWRVMAAVLMGAAVMAGCGNGDGDSDGEPTTTLAADDGSDPGSGGDLGLGAFSSDECRDAVEAMTAAAESAAGAFTGTGAAGDLGASLAVLQEFAERAPEEIRDDMRIVASAYSDFVDSIADLGIDFSGGQPPSPEAIAALQAAAAELEATGAQEAAERVTAWFEANCPTS